MVAGVRRGRGAHRPSRPWPWLALLVLATFAAYAPAWRGGMLWDDDAHLTAEALRSTDGVRRIWLEPGATQQYYPVVHTAFWLMARLWGHDTLGYHLVNIALHAASAVLLLLILRRLQVGGALLAAAAFALHPIQVESVAWMTELKNTLSTCLYLAAALTYLRYDETRRPRVRGLALALFLLALLTKTVTATLPAALLVTFWWVRGRLDWRDARPLIPFFALGLIGGLSTIWVERTLLGAQGLEYQLSAAERVLVAGRAFWFYLGTIAWPSSLTFIYPRWTLSTASAAAWAYPVAAVAALAAAWAVRRRSRAPLSIGLLYVIALAPALGFVNVYPFRYSYVADHFAYLATLPVFAAAGALLASLAARTPAPAAATRVVLVALMAALGALTWRQSRMYHDSEALFRETLARNPACWLCLNNLASSRLHGSDAEFEQAVGFLREAVKLNPLSAEVRNNLGGALQRQGRLDEALAAHEEAARLNPKLVDARYNIGLVHQRAGRLDAAVREYERVIAERPGFAAAHYNLGTIRIAEGRLDEAARHLGDAARLQPSDWQVHAALGQVLQGLGRTEAAIAALREAVRRGPQQADTQARTRADLGLALAAAGRVREALDELRQVVRIAPESSESWSTLGLLAAEADELEEAESAFRRLVLQSPASPEAHDNLGLVLMRRDRMEEAARHFNDAIRLSDAYAPAYHHLGLVHSSAGRTADAIEAFSRSLRRDPRSADAHNDLGAALAAAGRAEEAIRHFEEALRLDPGYSEARANLERARTDRRRR